VTPYEVPPGFLKARKKYRLPDPFRSAGAIWNALRAWRKGEANVLGYRTQNFELELLHAIKSDDHEFNEQLTIARESGDQPPIYQITAASAGVEAFDILFDHEQIETVKANWPTKRDVIQLAISILEAAGQPAPSKRHWSRVLNKIGLKDLPEISRGGRPRKLVT
jgi:hypothetical protein